jgi:hypothetical protein
MARAGEIGDLRGEHDRVGSALAAPCFNWLAEVAPITADGWRMAAGCPRASIAKSSPDGEAGVGRGRVDATLTRHLQERRTTSLTAPSVG